MKELPQLKSSWVLWEFQRIAANSFKDRPEEFQSITANPMKDCDDSLENLRESP